MLGEVVRSTDNSLACEPFSKHVSQPPNGLPPILLAERGGKQNCCRVCTSIQLLCMLVLVAFGNDSDI